MEREKKGRAKKREKAWRMRRVTARRVNIKIRQKREQIKKKKSREKIKRVTFLLKVFFEQKQRE